jgi:glucokinase
VDLINDLEANAWGLRCLSREEFYTLNPGVQVSANQALISAGTGLGEAGLYWDGKSHRPFPSEGGHCGFAPTNSLEDELLLYLRKQFGHVSYERIVSGSGLHQLYRFLIDSGKEKEDPAITALMLQMDPAKVVTEKGKSGECTACRRACQMFMGIYGSESGNLALKMLALGGLFIGGGIAPHFLDFFKEGGFMKAFCDKGRFFTLLKDIPVKVVLNDKTALLGAARFAQEL